MKYILILAALLATSAIAKDNKPEVNYAGGGRYTCSNNSATCAQIDANNRQVEADRQREYDRQREQTDRYLRDGQREEDRQQREYGR